MKTLSKALPAVSEPVTAHNARWEQQAQADPAAAPWLWHPMSRGTETPPIPTKDLPGQEHRPMAHPPRAAPQLGTLPSSSFSKGNNTHSGRLMQFISLMFSYRKIYWSFSKINSDAAASLCAFLSSHFKIMKSHKVVIEGSKEKKCIFFFVKLH